MSVVLKEMSSSWTCRCSARSEKSVSNSTAQRLLRAEPFVRWR